MHDRRIAARHLARWTTSPHTPGALRAGFCRKSSTLARLGRSVVVTSFCSVPMPRVNLATKTATPADTGAFVREHQTAVWRYLRLLGADPATADDLLQETFLRFLRRPTTHPDSGAILRTIARGLWIDRHRWLQRRRVVQWAEHVDEALATTADSGQEPWLDALHACRDKLAERARRALDLAYRDGLGRQEVADALELAPNTVRNLLAQTRQVLRSCIEKRIRAGEGAER